MLVSCCVLLMLVVASDSTRPHIIFIVADDMGWNDVSFHGSDQIPTPNIDALAYNGVILNSHYVQPLCTPTRAALMTGRYPINLGMQGDPMLAAEPRGLPMMKILPEYLKDLGYVTRAIGKWHLGFFQSIYTPTYRGFDSHLGYWAGSISYYDHIVEDMYSEDRILSGHDFRRNMTTAWDLEGKYATDAFTDEAVRIIDEHDDSKPLFLYLSHLAVHAGNTGKLLEAPQEEIDKFRHIPNPNRRTYAAMVSKMDESVGRVVEGLEKKGMLHNSIIVFISDNGAPTVGIFQNWGSNYPLRGMKASLWEGGVRGVGLVWSPLIRQPRRVSDGLMHVSDWLPTLYRAAGGNANYLDINLDGVDQWHSIVNNEDSPRTHVLLNINEKESTSALRIGKWKLTVGSYGKGGKYDKHFGDNGIGRSYPKYNISSITNSRAWRAISYNRITATWSEIDKLRHSATVTCNKHNVTTCNPWGGGNICLFDMYSDPCEYKDMRWSHPDVTEKMYNIVNEYGRTLVLQINQPWDLDGADPRRFNNTWSPWDD